MEELQNHAVLTAEIARTIALKEGKPDDAFVAGMLHDVGKLILAMEMPVYVENSGRRREAARALDARRGARAERGDARRGGWLSARTMGAPLPGRRSSSQSSRAVTRKAIRARRGGGRPRRERAHARGRERRRERP